jgi:tRNA(Ile)-lysidine synthase
MPMPSMHVLNSGINDLIMNNEKSAEIKWSEHVIRRFNGRLYFLNKAEVMPCEATENISWSINQPITLSHPIGKLNTKITEGNGISLDKCSSNLQIKFRKGGEKMFFNADNGSKTLKDFFNEKKILPWIRDKVPLIYDDQHLICIGDLWINKNFIATESERAFTIHWNTKMKIL